MMTAELYKMFSLWGSKRVAETAEWVMGSCPFAAYTHAKGTDRRPSFGITKAPSHIYHCFSCGQKGEIHKLPTVLEFLSNKSYQHLREYLWQTTNAFLTIEYEAPMVKTLKEIPLGIYHRYPPMREWKCLTKKDINLWDIRYDEQFNRVLYPVFNSKGILYGIRGRSLTEKMFVSYTHLVPHSADPKSKGIWFGEVFELKPNKALVIVEGERDAVLLKRFVSNVWASMGSSLSKAQEERLASMKCPIVVFFDNDKAGQEGVRRILKTVGQVRVPANYFGCKDPAEAVERNLVSKILTKENLKEIT